MSEPMQATWTADEARATNAELDRQLRALLAQLRPEHLHTPLPDGEWTVAENLAHLGEFPRYFAADLLLQLEQEGATVGRTHEHPQRIAAVASGCGRDLDDLRAGVEQALGELRAALARLQDADLARVSINRKYGPEALAAYLDRYVLDHKAAHIQQLQRALNALASAPQTEQKA